MPVPRLFVAPIWPLGFVEVALEKWDDFEFYFKTQYVESEWALMVKVVSTKESCDFGFQV